MDEQIESPTKQTAYNSPRLYKKKSLLISSNDPEKLAKESSRVRLIRDRMATEGKQHIGNGYEEYLSKFPNLGSTYSPTSDTHEQKRNQFFTTYPSRFCLRWNPCVDVSSGEDICPDWKPRKKDSRCHCGNCTSQSCPSRKSTFSIKPTFKDNIMTFSDKCIMTVKLSNAGCNTKTPLVTPKASTVSLRSSNSQPKFQSDYYSPPCSKLVYRKPRLLVDSLDGKPYYDEAVRDTDDRDCPAVRNAYAQHCNMHNSGTQHGEVKKTLYNEGISEKVAERYPYSTEHCPHKVMYGGRTFYMNKWPNYHCQRPPAHEHLGRKDSMYHQRCKMEYTGPVYYDQSTEDVRRVVAIPSMVPIPFRPPVERISREPFINLPKKVITSQRNIEEYIDRKHLCTYEPRLRRKKTK